MTETDARAVLLLQACVQAGQPGADDLDWAGREARRDLGVAAPAEAWLAARARLALQRLAEREPAWRRVLALALAQPGAAGTGMAGAVLATAALALGIGVLGDGLGAAGRINLLSLPLLGLLGWNLAVFAGLLVGWMRARLGAAVPDDHGAAMFSRHTAAAAPRAAASLPARTLARLQALADRLRLGAPASDAQRRALTAFAADWLAASRPLQAWRAALLLHAGAAALALGAVLGLYLRGLAADYQAGWDSTFLQPPQVRALLGGLLGPASALAGLPLPDADALAALRLSAGGGENAAPWIHRWALTLGLGVVLPRVLLAAAAAWRARQLARQLPLPVRADLQQLLQQGAAGSRSAADADAGGAARAAVVLPCSYTLDARRLAALPGALAGWLGAGVRCTVQPSLPLGAADDLPSWLPAALQPLAANHADGDASTAGPPLLVLLFALTATPEPDTHGALVRAVGRALAAAPAPRPVLQVAVDMSGFLQRLSGADAARRLAERRAAWEQLLLAQGLSPGFIDLGA